MAKTMNLLWENGFILENILVLQLNWVYNANWPPRRVSSFETSALETLYGNQFTLSIRMIKAKYLVIPLTDALSQFFLRNLLSPPPPPYSSVVEKHEDCRGIFTPVIVYVFLQQRVFFHGKEVRLRDNFFSTIAKASQSLKYVRWTPIVGKTY